MLRLVFTGILAALFFSSTFVLNRAMSLEGGHWFWTASLRYGWMSILLCIWLLVTGRGSLGIACLKLFCRHWLFWTIAGSVGFGIFYALISFSASYAPGWVVAATWQMTILATPLVLLLFGRKVSASALSYTLIVLAGVLLINIEQATSVPLSEVLLGALPVLVAAVAYPLGNQMVWEARTIGDENRNQRFRRWLPAIEHPAMEDAICRVLLLTLGSFPLWTLLLFCMTPSAPSKAQLVKTLLVALLSGVVATSLFLGARHMAKSPSELAAVDCTQSMEVVFCLAGEALFLGGVVPGVMGWTGIALTLVGLVLYLQMQKG